MNRVQLQSVLTLSLFFSTRVIADQFYVTPNGNDTCLFRTGNCGVGPNCDPNTSNTVTLRNALTNANLSAGDTVTVCPGLYMAPSGGYQSSDKGSTNGQPIQFNGPSLSNGVATIDGSNGVPGGFGVISLYRWKNAVFRNLTLQHSTRGNGILLLDHCNGITLDNLTIWDIWQAGVNFNDSANSTLQNSDVSYTVRENYPRHGSGGHAAVGSICCGVQYCGSPVSCPSNIQVISNTIHDNIGECITLGDQDGSLIDRNTTYNCFGANIYLTNATATIVRNNYAYNLIEDLQRCPPNGTIGPGCNCDQGLPGQIHRPPDPQNPNPSPGCFYKSWGTWYPADAIALSKEGPNAARPDRLHDITIYNNVTDHNHFGFTWWRDDNWVFGGQTYDHIVFSNNVIKGAVLQSVQIDPVQGGSAPGCSRFENNVVYGTAVNFADPGAWSPGSNCTAGIGALHGSINNNLFVDGMPPNLPPGDAPNIVPNPLGDARLCNPNELNLSSPSILGYFVTTGSAAIGSALYQPLAPLDYDGISRVGQSVNIGINQSTVCR